MNNLKTLVLDQKNINLFLKGGCSKITEILDMQPEKGIIAAIPITTNQEKWGWINKDGILESSRIPPYISRYGGVNSVIWIRETFSKLENSKIIYKASTTNPKEYTWNKPQRMSKDWSRLNLTVSSIRIYRSTEKEIETLGEKWFSETTFIVHIKEFQET